MAATIGAWLPLATALAAYAGFMWGNIGAVPVVARWLWRGGRGRHTALWCAKSIVLFALVSLIGLLIAGRAGAVIALPAEFGPARQLAISLAGDGRGIPLWWMVLALVAGGVIGGLVDRFRPRGRPWMLGDISRLMPRHRRDLIGGAAMAIVAGTSEELFFRLFVPLAVAMATGSATAGFALSVILFAGAHGYQGWVGVVTTGGVGVLLTLFYLMIGSLGAAMLVHVVLDLNGLVLRPVMAGVLRVSSSSATRS